MPLKLPLRLLILAVAIVLGALMAVVLVSSSRHGRRLTAAQAGALARTLANNQAQGLYGIRPFPDGRPAESIRGCWAWHYRRGWGRGDIEATVKFEADGANPSVSVTPLFEVY